jgi:hypothetical protein
MEPSPTLVRVVVMFSPPLAWNTWGMVRWVGSAPVKEAIELSTFFYSWPECSTIPYEV